MDKPGILDRLRARYPWFDHAIRAEERYRDRKGNFFAAGITYYTVFALFPLIMVAFAIGGFVLSRQPDLLSEIEDKVKQTVSGQFGQQLVELIDSAIASRTSVGITGLAVGLWAGLGWIAKLREALSAMWEQRNEGAGFVRTKLNDLAALLSTFVAIVFTLSLTALSNGNLMRKVLGWFGLQNVPGVGVLLQVLSLLVAVGISWLLFTWMIARLPREGLSIKSSLRAGLLAAIAFEVFKQLASIYLGRIMHGPAGTTFGPVLGLLVFAYVTARLILFATAWAATASENLTEARVAPPEAAVIAPRDLGTQGTGRGGALVAGAVGALGALGLSRLLRRRR